MQCQEKKKKLLHFIADHVMVVRAASVTKAYSFAYVTGQSIHKSINSNATNVTIEMWTARNQYAIV